ncbi:hypothetical protein [Phenylobacterium sp.]|uniref:hypothetical protein n=1 Tax=Phenylobacterium sp. TaxID=1871053 RepID=UPI0012189DD0|nr:hypothetical protein [Phenylobacterium sp.]THD51250.1 MAG: hypothetical protein E8A12_21460 [Phenylobacterium sp.]
MFDERDMDQQESFVGFRTYADDTPRRSFFDEPDFAHDVMFDEEDAPHHGDTEQTSPAEPEVPKPKRRPAAIIAALAASGVAVAGIAVLYPSLSGRSLHLNPPIDAGAPKVHIQVSQAVPSSPLAPVEATSNLQSLRLETLRPVADAMRHTAGAAVSGMAASPTTPPTSAASDDARQRPQFSTPSDVVVAQTRAPPDASLPEPVARAAPWAQAADEPQRVRARLPAPLNCGRPVSPAQDVVCEDPGLVEADRQMVLAYTQATAAGAPADLLWTEQVDWLNAREAAARRSHGAVERLYRERIRDLRAEAGLGVD